MHQLKWLRIGTLSAVLAVGGFTANEAFALGDPLLPGGSLGPLSVDNSGSTNVIAGNNRFFEGRDANDDLRFTGELRSRVVREVDNTLTFYFQVTNLGGGFGDALDRTTMLNYTGFETNVGYRTDNPFNNGLDPTLDVFPRFADRDSSGDPVGFDFNTSEQNKIQAGETTVWYFIDTDATLYRPGSFSAINGATATVKSYAPAVPVPAAAWLLGSALVGFGVIGARKRRGAPASA